MQIVVLGSAAGGGFPQWNCNAPTSRGAREGILKAKWRTQASLAVSADGKRWLLLNASPDFRQQVLSTPILWPGKGLRHSPIEAVLLTGAEIDQIGGLLSMRESQPFRLLAPSPVLAALSANPIFDALNERCVHRQPIQIDARFEVEGVEGPLGLQATAFSVPGKVPLYMEGRNGNNLAGAADETIGIEIASGRSSFFFLPGCAVLNDDLRKRLRGAELVFFDGTLWQDDEMRTTGVGQKTGRRMGHMSIDGPDGTLAAFRDLDVRRKIFIHVNTTNPVLIDDSPERMAISAAGWEVGEDGMEVTL